MNNNYSELREREKELDCIYELVRIITEPENEITGMLEKTLKCIARAMKYPSKAGIHIKAGTVSAGSEPPENACIKFVTEKTLTGNESLKITAWYLKCEEDFYSREKDLIQSAAVFIAYAIDRSYIENELGKKNIAIREILTHMSNEKNQFQELSRLLTSRELDICYLIKNGESTKNIADMLKITSATVERHRCTIRKKMGLSRKKVNLKTFLKTMQ